MELEELEKLGLTEDQLKGVEAYTSGLKSKKDEILDEKKSLQSAAEESKQALDEARKVAAQAKEEKLKIAGDMDGLKEFYENQLAEETAKTKLETEKAQKEAEKSKESLNKYHHGNGLNAAMSLIHDDFKDVAIDKLSNMVNVAYNEQGDAVTTYQLNGEVVATNADELKSWALTQPSFKRIMNGVDSSGAGATNTGNTGGKPLTLTEKARLANQQQNR